ncbi:hypothetical protein GCM10020358_39220 [Amorphoplanes nipponensis]|uniref:Uncharacterized protein n=1 Tax=Actinoplanes nipponensis TaxID=135950 RepID=A0A919JJW6_9ACTN|nr:hypothetical protein Ani05nite_45720 [Actinoplanes nipponensis]
MVTAFESTGVACSAGEEPVVMVLILYERRRRDTRWEPDHVPRPIRWDDMKTHLTSGISAGHA